jgi:hyperosmotically inducible protein
MNSILKTSLAAALAFGAFGVTQAAQPPMTPGTQSADSEQPGTDAWITTKVKAELMTTKGIPSTDISVTTTNGVVTLSGVLDTKAQVEKSVAVAQSIKGVKSVDSSALKTKG